MLDFIYEEGFWMKEIIGAAITTAGTILVAVIAYQHKLNKAISDIAEIKKHESLSKEHGSLSKEHGSLSKEHESLSKEHEGISKELTRNHESLAKSNDGILLGIRDSKELLLGRIDDTRNVINTMNNMMFERKGQEEYQYKSLDEKQKAIIDSVNNLEKFGYELKKAVAENTQLREDIKELKAINRELQSTNQMLKVTMLKNMEDEKTRQFERDGDEAER